MRLVAGTGLVVHRIGILLGGTPAGAFLPNSLETVAGLLLIVGLWTPIAGMLVASIEFWQALSHLSDPWVHLQLGTVGAALAMIGPGAWSVDARLFGWKRIDIPTRKSKCPPIV
jgi:putative oxidoreductase